MITEEIISSKTLGFKQHEVKVFYRSGCSHSTGKLLNTYAHIYNGNMFANIRFYVLAYTLPRPVAKWSITLRVGTNEPT